MGHMSEDSTEERVVSTGLWPKWEQELIEYIKTCERCQKANRKNWKNYGLLQHIEELKHPWETINMKHPVFPVILVKPYLQAEKDKFPSRKKNPTPPEIVEVEDSPGPVKKIIEARMIRMNGKDQTQYLVRFKNQTEDKDKWLAEDVIPDGSIHLRRYRAFRRTENSHT
ncbi:hypothetical protein O181_092736 [Austropuccinia psidii MF-1]|uniref:Integrase zinc-binding domain-containing protein n=1 Tax=Austropuccinia psidii MF-1 TaxID=1389203 RepID=A0A9Q3J037_9BASI|nr:hypothetical protein [Austropuccinia psidii MF-1]